MSRDLRKTALSLFLWALGEGLFAYLLPLYLADLGADPPQIGGIVAAFMGAQMLAMVPAGVLTDRLGARWVMIACWWIGLASAALMALTGRLWPFSAALILYGTSAGVIPALTGYITSGRSDLPPERVLTQVFAAFSAGMVVSPLVGGLLGERLGLRAPFVVAVVLFTLSTAAILTTARQPRKQPAVDRSQKRLLANGHFVSLMVVVFVVVAGLSLGVPLAPNYLQARWSVPIAQIGLLGSAASLGEVVAALVLGRRSPGRALIALQVGGMIHLAILLTTGRVAWLALAFFLRAGLGISRQFVDALATRIVPPAGQGRAFATSALVYRGGGVLSSAITGWLYDLRPALPFQLGLWLIPLAIGLTWWLAPRSARPPETPVLAGPDPG